MAKDIKPKWYAAGLHFKCAQCSSCCSGPGEGYIWITKPEVELLADYMGISQDVLRKKYLKRVGLRLSIIEDAVTKDCIFLKEKDGIRGCEIYPVRPNQCRTWPFWSENLKSPDEWNLAAKRCSGINRGKLYTFEQIENIRRSSKWWTDE